MRAEGCGGNPTTVEREMKVKGPPSAGGLRWDGAWHQMKRAQHHRPILNASVCASGELDLIDLRQSTAVGTRKVVSFAWIV